MLTNEKIETTPGAASTAPFSNSPIDQYGGSNKPYARTLRLQSVVALLLVALSSNEHRPLTAGQISHMEYLTQFAYFELELIGEEIEEIIPA